MKCKKTKLIISAVVAGIAVVTTTVGIVAHAQIDNFIHKTFYSPTEYYRFVEEKNRDEAITKLKKNYHYYTNQLTSNEPVTSSVKLEACTGIKSLLSLAGLSSLSSAEFSTVSQQSKDGQNANYTFKLNDKDLLSANMLVDFSNSKMYMQCPELSSSYLNFSYSPEDLGISEEDASYLNMMYDYKSWLPSENQAADFYVRYTDLFLDHITDVKKSSDTLTADDVTTKCTTLSVSCNEKETKAMMKDMYKELKEDPLISDLLEKTNKDSLPSYQESCDDLLDSLENEDTANLSSDMLVYVNASGEIIGRSIALNTDDEPLTFNYFTPIQKNKMGVDISLSVDGTTYLAISGTGAYNKGKLSGDFTLSLGNNDEQLVLLLKSNNLSATEDGYLNGTINVRIDKEHSDIDTLGLGTLANYSMDLTFSNSIKERNLKITFLTESGSAKTEWIAVTFSTKPEGKIKSCKPSDDATVYSMNNEKDVKKYENELLNNIDSLSDKISEATGLDTSVISSYINRFLPENSDDSEY